MHVEFTKPYTFIVLDVQDLLRRDAYIGFRHCKYLKLIFHFQITTNLLIDNFVWIILVSHNHSDETVY